MLGEQNHAPRLEESYRQPLKEFVAAVFMIGLPVISILLIFPLNILFGLMGQAVGVGLQLNSLFAGSVLLLASGKGRAVRITLALLAFALYLGFFYIMQSTEFVAEEALKAMVPHSLPFLTLAVSRTLYRATFPPE